MKFIKPILKKTKKQYLCFYDIEKDKTRRKMIKFLKKFGTRIQKSVFIIFLKRQEKEEIFAYFKKIKDKDDKIGIVYLCDNCFAKIDHLPKLKFKNFFVV